MSGIHRRNPDQCAAEETAKRLNSAPTMSDIDQEEQARQIKEQESPDWTKRCSACGQTPIVRETGMCGPCTFGEADTAGGNW